MAEITSKVVDSQAAIINCLYKKVGQGRFTWSIDKQDDIILFFEIETLMSEAVELLNSLKDCALISFDIPENTKEIIISLDYKKYL